ncbi:DivIVA domain-containing protein [Anaerosporobacter sp.]|uniref:DivIVA domain-containing protein n=1 Tax=Anaerosporobacter sp. TaxID=1872529 RepID=UPI00286EB50D|nr:DivIVA domain-containing protein [Anaerosporobacter sp.]
MLTPIEIQSKNFKTGFGYDRKDVDGFMRDVLTGYERLYKENVELKDKISVLNDGIQYYKTIEKTLQKALVLAEQTAEETKQAALKTAKAIEKEARGKADLIIVDAKNELNHINQMITALTSQYESYKVQYKHLAATQIELLQSPTFELTLMNSEYINMASANLAEEVSAPLHTQASKEDSTSIEGHEEIQVPLMEESPVNEVVSEVQDEEADKVLAKKLVDEFIDEPIAKKTSVEDLFTKEELEAFEKIARYVNTATDTTSGSDAEDSDFEIEDEVASTLDTASSTSKEKSNSSESEFEFIDFEVNLD